MDGSVMWKGRFDQDEVDEVELEVQLGHRCICRFRNTMHAACKPDTVHRK